MLCCLIVGVNDIREIDLKEALSLCVLHGPGRCWLDQSARASLRCAPKHYP